MNLLQPAQLKQKSADILRRTQPHFRQTVVLHCAVSLAVLVVLMVVDLLIGNAISNTEGLSGLGTKSVLQTVQSALSTGVNVLLPFWEIGILYACIQVVRTGQHSKTMLKRGFERFGPVLRYTVLQIFIMLGVGMLCINAMMFFSVFIPVPAELEAAIAQMDMTALPDSSFTEQVPVDVLYAYMLPIMILFSVLYGGILIHLGYRFRMGNYLLLDEEKTGARMALAVSNRLTKGNKWNLFKLDLSFWWYYLLQGSAAALVFLPELLKLLGVTLPIGVQLQNVLCYLLYAGATLVLSYFAGAYVQTTYACAYEQLQNQEI